MRILRPWLSVALLLPSLLAPGCKSAPPNAASPQPAASPIPAKPASIVDARPVIVAFGDSLTAGYGADPGQSYPDYLQMELDSRGYHYRVVNKGISGDTTKDAVDRLQDVLDLHPFVVIVAFGGNDGLRGLPLSVTRQNLDTILARLQEAHIATVLGGITLPPNYGADYIREFNRIYAEEAHTRHLPWLPFLLKNVFGTPGAMQQDGIHATAAGNRQVARNLLPLLTPLLRKEP